ncbi:MAG: hypothetical protein A3E79_08950 [Burkholderiales bacterium RIFCSPHIGHO2_12_FULL_61_11]|nr:MAG: hypothetical protein A3E79_08950 [Burkholderiales bacterium RIFCSPHIGHO2_12_FULL_61_11]
MLTANAALQQPGEGKSAFGRAALFVWDSVFHHGLHLFKVFLVDQRGMAGYPHDVFHRLGVPAFAVDLVEQPQPHVTGVLQNHRH